MTTIRQYTDTTKQISGLVYDDSTGYFVWGFQDSDDNNLSYLKKFSAFDLNQNLYDVELEGLTAIKIIDSTSYIFVLVNDATYLYVVTLKSYPYSNTSLKTYPIAFPETPVDFTFYNNNLYFLLPGNSAGTNAKVIEIVANTGAYVSTIDLSDSGAVVNEAAAITTDDTNLWVVTDTDPVKLVRIYDDGGWTYTVTTMSP